METGTIRKKLKNIGHFLWINLDSEVNRQEHMNALFDEYEISNTRISAVDARGDNDASEYLIGRIPDNVSQTELACSMSHLKAIKHFYYETDLPHIVICEDDIVFDTVPYWPFSWTEFMSMVPYDWDVLQCAITSTRNLRANIHPHVINDFCAAFYVISRHHAEKLIKHHIRGDKYKLDQGIKPRAVSEEIIYNSGKTYSIPLFTYRYDFESGIHQDHVGAFHKQNVDGVMGFWKNRPQELGTEQLLDYDYYEFYLPMVGPDPIPQPQMP